MRILIINTDYKIGGSVGRIASEIASKYVKEGHKVAFAYGRECGASDEDIQLYKIGNRFEIYSHVLYTRLTDKCGFASKHGTQKFVNWANSFDPDLVWLHNIHGYYINIEILFDWIKSRPDMQVKWTLHDCWAFTGHCAYFTYNGCNKWKSRCEHCQFKRDYPQSILLSQSSKNYEHKKKIFAGVHNMTIITPSKWLAGLVKESFLAEYPVEVVHNKIDRNVFKPTSSNFKERYGLQDKKIVLGVANVWDKRKGLEDFYRLALVLPKNYVIVLVGLSEDQIKNAPNEIIKIKRTSSPKELAAVYTAADVFLNPSKEETFGMTSVEALYCGTKPVVLKGTACEEIAESYGGLVVENNIDDMLRAIISITGGSSNTYQQN